MTRVWLIKKNLLQLGNIYADVYVISAIDHNPVLYIDRRNVIHVIDFIWFFFYWSSNINPLTYTNTDGVNWQVCLWGTVIFYKPVDGECMYFYHRAFRFINDWEYSILLHSFFYINVDSKYRVEFYSRIFFFFFNVRELYFFFKYFFLQKNCGTLFLVFTAF